MSSAAVAAACRPAFARHETFHPRYGWLRKAYLAARRGSDSFSRASAPVDLGVGKNMVNAIRYWGMAYKVLAERADPNRPRLPQIVTSAFGEVLLSEDGWDPYLEDEGSLWLLHWMLLRRPCLAPTWWIAFNTFPSQQWEEEGLATHASGLIRGLTDWPDVVASSIRKDVNCLVRTLAPRKEGRQGLDDVIDSPFRELHLLEAVPGESHAVRFPHGMKPGLPDEIVVFAALDFASIQSQSARSITLPTLCRSPGSPGMVYKLSEDAIHESLLRVVSKHEQLHLAEPAGLRQLLFDDDPEAMAWAILGEYFKRRTGSNRRFRGDAVPEADLRSEGAA